MTQDLPNSRDIIKVLDLSLLDYKRKNFCKKNLKRDICPLGIYLGPSLDTNNIHVKNNKFKHDPNNT